MNVSLPLPDHQKLTVTYRVEPGCLGPEGKSYVDAFCVFAQKKVVDLDPDFICWKIVPRTDKNLPEMQYHVRSKQLTHDKADKYLNIFGKSLDEFEDHIMGESVALIDQFFKR
ncbi:hypothetical protein ACVBE9_08960 [Eionea flava]